MIKNGHKIPFPQVGHFGFLLSVKFILFWYWVHKCICVIYFIYSFSFNPFTPKSDQFLISPAASPELLHNTVMENLAFHSLPRWKMIILPIFTTSLIHFSLKGWENVLFELGRSERLNPFTPESDQCQNSPAASQEIWHHTVWRTWLFIAYSDEKWLYYKFSLHHSYNRFLKGWENTLFELRSERVDPFTPKFKK